MPGAFTLNYFPLTKSQQELAPHAEQTDQNSQEYLDALKNKSLFALQLTQNQMPTFGGTAFADRLQFEPYFRDARD